MFKTRLLSGILLVIIALATIISGGYVLFFTLLAVSLIGMRELYKAMKVQRFIMWQFCLTSRDMELWPSSSAWC